VLRAQLDLSADELVEREFFTDDGPTRLLERAWMHVARDGGEGAWTAPEVDAFRERCHSAGWAPSTAAGALAIRDAISDTERLLEARRCRLSGKLRRVEHTVEMGAWRVLGVAGEVDDGGVLHVPCVRRKLGPRDLLRAHLTLTLLACAGEAVSGAFAYWQSDNHEPHLRTRVSELTAPSNPAEVLGALLDVFGDIRARPVLLFQNASRAYAAKVDRDPEGALADAIKSWASSDGERGDVRDPYVRAAFPEGVPFVDEAGAVREEFDRLARIVWGGPHGIDSSKDGLAGEEGE
jgi:exonuclease V gamma subunit